MINNLREVFNWIFSNSTGSSVTGGCFFRIHWIGFAPAFYITEFDVRNFLTIWSLHIMYNSAPLRKIVMYMDHYIH